VSGPADAQVHAFGEAGFDTAVSGFGKADHGCLRHGPKAG
jgi:hypothetical protein